MIDGDQTVERWAIQKMIPDKSDAEIAEMAASFFNNISQDFTPLQEDYVPLGGANCPEPHEISARIKKMKKTRSTVTGDI